MSNQGLLAVMYALSIYILLRMSEGETEYNNFDNLLLTTMTVSLLPSSALDETGSASRHRLRNPYNHDINYRAGHSKTAHHLRPNLCTYNSYMRHPCLLGRLDLHGISPASRRDLPCDQSHSLLRSRRDVLVAIRPTHRPLA